MAWFGFCFLCLCRVFKDTRWVAMASRLYRFLSLSSLLCTRGASIFTCDGGAIILEESRVRTSSDGSFISSALFSPSRATIFAVFSILLFEI